MHTPSVNLIYSAVPCARSLASSASCRHSSPKRTSGYPALGRHWPVSPAFVVMRSCMRPDLGACLGSPTGVWRPSCLFLTRVGGAFELCLRKGRSLVCVVGAGRASCADGLLHFCIQVLLPLLGSLVFVLRERYTARFVTRLLGRLARHQPLRALRYSLIAPSGVGDLPWLCSSLGVCHLLPWLFAPAFESI